MKTPYDLVRIVVGIAGTGAVEPALHGPFRDFLRGKEFRLGVSQDSLGCRLDRETRQVAVLNPGSDRFDDWAIHRTHLGMSHDWLIRIKGCRCMKIMRVAPH